MTAAADSFRAGATLVFALRAARVAVVLGVLGTLFDAGFLLASDVEPTPARLFGWLAGLGLGLLWLVPFCVGFGLSLHRLHAGRAAWRGLSWLQGHEPARVGALIAAGASAMLLAPCAIWLTQRVILGMARPDFAALTIVGVHLGLVLLGLACFALTRELGEKLVHGLRRTPLRAVLATPLRLLGVLLLLAFMASAVALVVFWSTLRFLPWPALLSVSSSIALCPLVIAVAQSTGKLARRSFAAGLVGVSVTALLALVWLSRASDTARLASLEPLAGKVGSAALQAGFDFDRDGHLGFFGGSDCAPFDEKRHPGAVDKPENGVDEDCDGADLNRSLLGAKLSHSFGLPPKLPKRPPIVLITIDTFAAKRLSMIAAAGGPQAAKNTRVVTPRLDAFAKTASVFRKCFAQGPSTRLSFPSIFTSRWDSQLSQRLAGRHPYPIEGSERMLAEVVKDAGYDTVAIVSDGYFTPRNWSGLLQGFSEVIETPLRKAAMGKHTSQAVTDAALEALHAPRKQPLFLWVHYYDAHSPHVQPQGAPVFGKRHEDIYDAELFHVDAEVGRLLDGIDSTLGDDALRVLTADHGIAFDPPRHIKLNYGYDLSTPVLHVPLLFAGEGVRAQVLDGLVSTMDIAPTLANILRIKKKLPFRGASLVPELFEGKQQRPQTLHHQFFLNERKWQGREPLELASVRTERYSLVSDRVKGTFELYDYLADYFETQNLADDPQQRDVLHGLKQRLALYLFDVHSQAPRAAHARRKP